MDLTDENDYDKKLEQYKTAELTVEENDLEISYLKAKLEELNKNIFQKNKLIKQYETKYEETTMQSINISWKQKKANTLLLTIKQYEAQLDLSKEEDISFDSSKSDNLKYEIELLEIKCSKNTEMIIQLNEELSELMDEYTRIKFKT